MNKDDTVKLLKECDAGTKTAVNSIEEVIDRVSDVKMKQLLGQSLDTHQKIGNQIHDYLNALDCSGKDPNSFVKMMSWTKINAELMQNGSDEKIADLMTDGCNMGIKSICRYLNQYSAAEQQIKRLSYDLVEAEHTLMCGLRNYL